MRRPIIFISGFYILGMALHYDFFLGRFGEIRYENLILALPAFTLVKLNEGECHCRVKHRVLIAVILMALGCLNFSFNYFSSGGFDKYIGKKINVRANIEDVYEKKKGEKSVSGIGRLMKGGDNRKINLVLRITEVNGRALPSEKVMVSSEVGKHVKLSSLAGLAVKTGIELKQPEPNRVPRGFNYREYLMSRGIRYSAYVDVQNFKIIGNSYGIGGDVKKCIYEVRERFKDCLYKNMQAREAGLVFAMIAGDKTGIDEDTQRSFRENTTAHVLAISGLHIGIIYLAISKIWRHRKKNIYAMVVIALLLFYVMLSGFAASTIRAFAIVMVHLISARLHRAFDLLNVSFVVLFILAVAKPLIIMDIGFQMSFLAIITIAVIARRLYKFKELGSLAGVQFGTSPFTQSVFNLFNPFGFLVNFPVVYLAGFVVVGGMLLLLVMPLDVFVITKVITSFLHAVCKVLIAVNDWFYAGGRFSYVVPAPSMFFLIIYYGGIFFFSSEIFAVWKARKRRKKIVAMVVCILICAVSMSNFTDSQKKEGITFLDVGQGDCTHIKTASGKNILIDGGGEMNRDIGNAVLKPYLLKNGTKMIDLAILTHLHRDHYDGLFEIARQGMIKKLIVTEYHRDKVDLISKVTKMNKKDIVFLTAPHKINLDKGVSMDVMYPKEDVSEKQGEKNIADGNLKGSDISKALQMGSGENENSFVIRLAFNGLKLLFTGDAGADTERIIKNEALKSDILKVGHHGSRYSSMDEFLTKVSPKVAVIQVGKNMYGHPSKETLRRLKNAGTAVYRNDTMGTVVIMKKRIFNKGNGKNLKRYDIISSII